MTQPQSEGPGGHDAVVTRKRGVGIVWLIPIVAAVIGAWLAVDAIRSQGPTFTIAFETAEGLVDSTLLGSRLEGKRLGLV